MDNIHFLRMTNWSGGSNSRSRFGRTVSRFVLSTCSATAENVDEAEVLSSCSFANVSVKVKNYRRDVSIRMY